MMIYVPIEQIDDNPFQERVEYGDIAELAEQIAVARGDYPESLGLMQVPRGRLLMRNGRYPEGLVLNAEQVAKFGVDAHLINDDAMRVQLAFGHRRLRAFRHLHETGAPGYEGGLFPVHVSEMTDAQMLDAVWAENSQRKNLSAIEEARLLARKLEAIRATGGGQSDLAAAWGLARSTVANKLRLLALPEEIQEANEMGIISERVAADLLRVQELATAVASRDWNDFGAHWQRPVSPSDFLDQATQDEITSDDVRQYVMKATHYAGKKLATAVADASLPHHQVRQATCKSCPSRANSNCFDATCLEFKKLAFAEDMAMRVAREFGLDYSAELDDFGAFRHDNNARNALTAVWEKRADYPLVSLVVGWQAEGAGLRPFRKGYLYADEQFDDDGRAGIVIGVRGGALPPTVQEEIAAQQTGTERAVEDVAALALQKSWDNEAGKIRQRVEKAAKAMLAEAMSDIANNERLQALVLQPDAEMMDEHEKFAKNLVAFLWDKGPGLERKWTELERVRAVETLIGRAGLNPAHVHGAEGVAARLRWRAVLALAFWYQRRTYSSVDTRAIARQEIEALLAAWWPDGDDGLDALRPELERALRDTSRAADGDSNE